MFGGDTTTTYILDTRQGSKVEKVTSSMLQVKGQFSKSSDYVARVFGNFLYTIDRTNKNLHVYAIKDKMWNYSSLTDLGIK